MSPSEYQELTEFFVAAFERHRTETREMFEALTSRIDVRVEALQGEIRIVAEGVAANRERIEENGRRIEENTRRIEENGRRIEENGRRIDALAARFDRVEHRLDVHEEP